MNRTHTILAITVVTAVLVGWQVLVDRESQRSEPSQPGQPTQLPEGATDLSQQQAEGEAAAENADLLPTTPDVATLWFARSQDTRCDRQTVFIPDARTGDLVEAIDCEEPEEIEVYGQLEDEALASLAYGDSHAAEVLGLRLILSEKPENEAIGLGLLYRAVALSADAETFQKAIGSRYAYLSVNGNPQIKNLKQLLVFNLIGEVLGGSGFNSSRIVRALRDADVEQQEIDEVRTGTRLILQRMADLQTEVTGNTSIREAIENA